MVAVLQLAIYDFDNDQKQVKLVQSAQHLVKFSFFTRHSVSNLLDVCSLAVVDKLIKTGYAQQSAHFVGFIPEQEYKIYCLFCEPKRVYVAVTDEEYDSRYALRILQQIDIQPNKTTPVNLSQMIVDVQNPAAVDKLLAIGMKLDEIKVTMENNIIELMKRGESLDSLEQKARNLNDASLDWFRQTKKLNRCCRLF